MKKWLKPMIIVLCLVLLLGIAACQYKQPAYKAPDTKDAFDSPFVDDSEDSDTSEFDLDELDETEDLEDDTEVFEEELLPEEEFVEAAEEVETEEVETEEVVEESTETEEFNAAVDQDIPRLQVTEGDTVQIKVKATDPDGDELTYTFEEPLTSKGTWKTKVGDAGEYLTTIQVTDGKTTTSKQVLIIVDLLNRPPVVKVSDVIEVNEGELVEIMVDANDPDGDLVSIKYSGWMVKKTKQTDFEDAGTHEVHVSVSDGQNVVEETVTVIVNDVNRAPEVELEF